MTDIPPATRIGRGKMKLPKLTDAQKRALRSVLTFVCEFDAPSVEMYRKMARAALEATLLPLPAPVEAESRDAPSEDKAENINDNPKSWIAWKREAEKHQATVAEMWVQFDRLRDATNRKKCGQAFMVGGHHIAPWGIVDHAISALDLSMMRADRIEHEQKRAAKAEAALAAQPLPKQDEGWAAVEAEVLRNTGQTLAERANKPLPKQGTGVDLSFQARVDPWLMSCFGRVIARDKVERNHRFLEEALELVQSGDCTASEAHQLVDYVFGRDVGDMAQEVGGVMNTLAALCLAYDLDMHEAGEVELARVWTKIDKIRAKQAAKPKHSPLP